MFLFPPCRRSSPASAKETSMTDLENKAETTPSTQTFPADADKPEVGHTTPSRIPNYLTMLVGSRFCFSFAGSGVFWGLRLIHGPATFLNKQFAFSLFPVKLFQHCLLSVRPPLLTLWCGLLGLVASFTEPAWTLIKRAISYTGRRYNIEDYKGQVFDNEGGKRNLTLLGGETSNEENATVFVLFSDLRDRGELQLHRGFWSKTHWQRCFKVWFSMHLPLTSIQLSPLSR